MVPLLKGLSEEKIVFVTSGRRARIPFPLKGIIRLLDKKGNTVGLVLDPATLAEIEEEAEASSPDFAAFLNRSRLSGRISGPSVKKKAGIK